MTGAATRSSAITRTTLASIILVISVLMGACGDSDTTSTTQDTATSTAPTTTAASTTTVAPPASTTTATETTTTLAPSTTTTAAPADTTTMAVVLVAPDDVLNVRDEPLGEIVFTLDPTATGIAATGNSETLDTGARWLEIIFEGRSGWVNQYFLTAEVEGASFAADPPSTASEDLAEWAQTGSGPAWGSIVSPKGFHVVHFDPMKTWPPGQNPFTDPTIYDWGGEATGPGEPVASDTFAGEVGASFAGVVGDQDLQTAVDQPLQGAESAPPFLPVEFQNFHYIAYHDPGDDPNVDGLDWLTWYVFFDWTGSGWGVVGMSVDGWAP